MKNALARVAVFSRLKALKNFLLVAGLVCLMAESAAAATNTITFNFTATNFVLAPPPGAPPPQNTVSGSVTVTFDPLVSSTGGVDAINLTIVGHTYSASEVGFNYNGTTKNMLIGGTLNGLLLTSWGTDDFALLFNVADATKLSLLLYSTSSRTDTAFDASPVTITISGSYYVDHYSNNINPLAADQVIRAINVGQAGTPQTSPTGDICENVYVFDNNQEMIACCACRLTPNELSSAAVGAQLTNHALTGAAPVAGVVKIAFTPVPAAGCQAETANLAGALAGLAAVFGTHLQAEPPSSPTSMFVTETGKAPQTLGADEAAFLPQACSFVRYLGSGAPGTCSCTAGQGAR